MYCFVHFALQSLKIFQFSFLKLLLYLRRENRAEQQMDKQQWTTVDKQSTAPNAHMELLDTLEIKQNTKKGTKLRSPD